MSSAADTPPIVILAPGRLGDIVTAEPIFRRAHEEEPQREVVLVTRPAFCSVMRACPYIARILVRDTKEEVRRAASEFPPGTRFLCVNCAPPENAGPPPAAATPPSPPETRCARLAGINPSLLNRFQAANGMPYSDEAAVFYLDESVEDPAGLPDEYLVFHCCSGGKSRQWQPEKFRALAECCFRRGVGVVEIGFGAVMKCDDPLYRPFCGDHDLHQVAKVIRGARALVGVESGMLHIANAFRVPGFVVTGALRGDLYYNYYCGMYRKPERVNFLRYYGLSAPELPVEPASYALERFLDGDPMSPEECDLFFLKYQLDEHRLSWHGRFFEALRTPWRRMRDAWIFSHRPRAR